MELITRLTAELRAEAERYAEVGALVDGTKLCRRLAGRLEAIRREWELEMLTLTGIARETGQSYSTAQRKVAKGTYPNVGAKHHPRVRRCDLERPT